MGAQHLKSFFSVRGIGFFHVLGHPGHARRGLYAVTTPQTRNQSTAAAETGLSFAVMVSTHWVAVFKAHQGQHAKIIEPPEPIFCNSAARDVYVAPLPSEIGRVRRELG